MVFRISSCGRRPSSRGVPALDGYTSHSFLPSSSAGIFPRTDRAARLTYVKRKSLSRRTYASDTVSRTIKGSSSVGSIGGSAPKIVLDDEEGATAHFK